MTKLMPALFVGHGSPMNAIEENRFSRAWQSLGPTLPRPRAILSISAHWETAGTQVTTMPRPETLYDFHGFPQPLYEVQYPAPGDPDLARSIKQDLQDTLVHLDFRWGLDHGTWSVLCHMFPKADVPVVQLSLDFDQPAEAHYALGRKLNYLRREGVLIMGSGNLVHNLRTIVWQDTALDWAAEMDTALTRLIRAGDHPALIDYPRSGRHAPLGIPTNEHFLPLLYILALQEPSDTLSFFNDQVTLGSISMRSVVLQ